MTTKKGNSDQLTAGRPRDRQKHLAVLRATRDLLGEENYDRLSIRKVADRAGVTRFLIYKWWDGSKAKLVEEALFAATVDFSCPDTGNFRDDVKALIVEMADIYAQPHFMHAVVALSAELCGNRREAVELFDSYTKPMIAYWQRVFTRAVKNREIARKRNSKALMFTANGALQQLFINQLMDFDQAIDFVTDVVCAACAES